MDERENLAKINNDIERQVSVCSKLDTLGCAFNGATASIGVAFEPIRALVEENGISKAASGIGTPIKSMFAADSFFKGPGRSLVSAFESTRALSETSGISKAMAGMGAPIKSGSVIDGLFKSVFAADSSFKVNLKSITASFKSTPALAEVSEGIKAASVIGDLLGAVLLRCGNRSRVAFSENSASKSQ